MKNLEEEKMVFIASASSIFRDSQNLFFTYKSLKNNIDFLYSKLEWYDPKEGRDNKYRMKELGGLLFQYRDSINITLIFLLAKSTEDLLYQINTYLNSPKVDFWENSKTCIYSSEVITLRHLNNCIKHNKGIISNNSKSGTFLLANGFSDNSRIASLDFNFEDYIYKTYLFNMDLLYQVFDVENKNRNLVKDHFYKMLIPDFIYEQISNGATEM